MPWGNRMNCGCPCGPDFYGGIGHITNCACDPIPGFLVMTSADESCNFDMFQSCTIVYGPTDPAYAALNLPANTFISVESFADPVGGGAMFQYYLTCQGNQFTLTRIYKTSPFGSPFRDGILYSWVVSPGVGDPTPANQCHGGQIRTGPSTFAPDPNPKLRLDDGSAFPGSDASCEVTIDEP